MVDMTRKHVLLTALQLRSLPVLPSLPFLPPLHLCCPLCLLFATSALHLLNLCTLHANAAQMRAAETLLNAVDKGVVTAVQTVQAQAAQTRAGNATGTGNARWMADVGDDL